jgi:formylglycine-generating enzyme required for sulfatase activity
MYEVLLKINPRRKQMKRLISGLLIAMVGIVMCGCQKYDNGLDSSKAITAFNFTSQNATGVITDADHTIAITVPFGTNVTSLTPTITYKGASVSPASDAAQDFTNPVTYTVTAVDSSTQTYKVTVKVALNSAKAITAFTFATPAATGVITEAAHAITITVPYGTNVTSLIPTITHTGASVSPASGTAQNFNNPVTYTVTAADSSTQTYTVTVTESLTAKAITAFNFTNPAATGVITESSHTIAVTVPLGTDATALIPTITYTGASVNPASGVAHDFTNPVTYIVTAGDHNTQNYIVTVTIWAPLSGMISVPAGTFQRDATPTNTSTVSAFHMSNQDITRSLFTAVTGLPDPSDTTVSTGISDPVQMASWYHALVFCNKLSMLEALTPVYTINGSTNPAVWIAANGGAVPTMSNAYWDAAIADWNATGYRLPTEMEWMWAAMGATSGYGYTSGTYTTGYAKAFAGSNGSNAIADYAWTSENSSNTTHPVGTKLPNELGLYDMSGNVWEWLWDLYADPYPSGDLSNYSGAASGTERTGHGGSWFNDASFAKVAYRAHTGSFNQDNYVGFRVVRRP